MSPSLISFSNHNQHILMFTEIVNFFKKLLPVAADRISDFTGYAAIRLPLNRASRPGEVTLSLPGYGQLNSFACGAVAGFMALKHFHPHADFSQFYARVNPTRRNGANAAKVARALRQSVVRVWKRNDLTFDDLCQAINREQPVLLVIHNPGSESRHWVTVYGYGRHPHKVFMAINDVPLLIHNAVPLHKFNRLWCPKGNGLICQRW